MRGTVKLTRIISLLIVISVLISVFAGCGGQKSSGGSSGSAGQIAFYANNSEPILDWDPSVEFSNGVIVLQNIYETLVRYIPETDTIEPLLAETWSKSDDGMSWTFNIRKGVKFHDGTDLNAEAVKFSIDRTIEMMQGAFYIWDPVESIEVADEYTVVFHLSYEAPVDIIASACYAAYIFSPTAVKANSEDWLSQGNDAGSGPYKLKSFKMGDEVVLEKYDDYWQGWNDKHISTVYIKKVPEMATRRQMLEKGEATIASPLTSEDNVALESNENVTVTRVTTMQNLLLFFNTQKAPLNDKLVRQALSYAFPYEDVVNYAAGGEAVKAHGVIPESLWGHGKDLKQYDYDLDKAKQLLAEAGYADGGFKLLTTYMSGDEAEKRSLELYQSELAKLNIEMEIRAMPWDSQWEMAKNPDPEKCQDMFVMYWWPDMANPYSWLFNLLHSEDDAMFNMAYYKNPEFDETIDEGNIQSGIDRKVGEQMFIDAQGIMMEDAPIIPMYDKQNVWVQNAKFKGYIENVAYPNVVFFHETYFE